MQMNGRMLGAWVLFVAASVGLQTHRELSAAPGLPGACNQCTCKEAPYWQLGNTYYGLRELKADGSTAPVNNMLVYPTGVVTNTPKNWSAACNAGSPTPAGAFPSYDYRDGTPDCTYTGTSGALVACGTAVGPSVASVNPDTGKVFNVTQYVCK